MIECALVWSGGELEAVCSTCGQATKWNKGPRIVEAEEAAPLCRSCGVSRAPKLVALLDLAETADKVGNHSRHLLTPPMKSLLELARAAETLALSPLGKAG